MDIEKEREEFEQHLTDTGLVEFSDYGFAVDESNVDQLYHLFTCYLSKLPSGVVKALGEVS